MGPISFPSEISPKEFAQFIGKEMRLSKVEYAPKPEAVPIFNFYMGKNTPRDSAEGFWMPSFSTNS